MRKYDVLTLNTIKIAAEYAVNKSICLSGKSD